MALRADEMVLTAEILDHLPLATAILENDRRVRFLSESARLLLAQRRGINVDNNVMTINRVDEKREFDKAFENVLASGQTALLTLRSRQGVPLLGVSFRWLAVSGDILLVFVPLDDGHAPLLDALEKVARLTKSECRLAMGLAEGLSLSEAAEKSGMKVGTARVVLHEIFNKTGARGQPALATFMARLWHLGHLGARP